jgi:hypothetical protein
MGTEWVQRTAAEKRAFGEGFRACSALARSTAGGPRMAPFLGFRGPIGGQREFHSVAYWRRERNCHQTLSAALSMTYESHNLRWMLPGESGGCGLHLLQPAAAAVHGLHVFGPGRRPGGGIVPGVRPAAARLERRSRCCTRRSARSAPRPGSRSSNAPVERRRCATRARPGGTPQQHGHRGADA